MPIMSYKCTLLVQLDEIWWVQEDLLLFVERGTQLYFKFKRI